MKLQSLLLVLTFLVPCECALAQTPAPGTAISKLAVDHLVTLLDEKDATTRGWAAGELISLQESYAESTVRKTLETGSANARIALATAIQFAQEERFLPDLVALLEADQDEVGKAAMRAFTSFASHQRLPPLKETLLDDGKPSRARVRAAKLLGQISEKEAVEALIIILDDQYQELVQVAYDSLRTVTHQDIENDQQAWLKWWQENKDKTRLEWLEDVIRGLKNSLAALKKDLEQSRDELSTLHIEQLKTISPSQDLKPFAEALKRSDLPRLQLYAIEALARPNGDAQAVAGLLSELLSTEQSGEVTAAACTALGRVGDADAKGPLLQQLSSRHMVVRQAAARSLGKEVFNLPEVIAQLSSLLEDAAEGVRAAACFSLGKLKAQTVSTQLLAMLKQEPSGDVRAEAVTALAEIGKPSTIDAVADRLLNDQVELVRYRAAEGLGKLGAVKMLKDKRKAIDPLCQALLKPDPEHGVRRACVIALAQIGDPLAVPALKQALKDSYSEVGTKAWEALLSITVKEPDLLMALAQDMTAQEQFSRAVVAYELLIKEVGSKPEHAKLVAASKARLAPCLVQVDRLSDALALYVELVSKQAKLWPEVVELLQRMKAKKLYKEVIAAVAELESKDPKLGGDQTGKQLRQLQVECKKLQSAGTEKPTS